MLNYNLPLTSAEAEFAAEHHTVIYAFLNQSGLPEEDFYDIVVFGYLRAVRKYLARQELQRYCFSTIAYRAMSCDVHHSKEYWMRAMRRGEVESFDEEIYPGELCDTVAESFTETQALQELMNRLTPMQRRIAMLRANGYHDREIADICHLKSHDVEQEMTLAQAGIISFPAVADKVAA